MIIGITGQYGTGKTTTAELFKELGAELLDVDKIGHQVLEDEAYGPLVEYFGNEILVKDSTISRKKLAGIVFKDKSKLEKLNQITHSFILSRVEQQIRGFSGIMVIDAAMLFEIGIDGLCDKIIAVKCDKHKILERDTERHPNEIELILQHQKPEDFFLKKADFIVNNNSTLEKTKQQIKDIWNKVK